MNAMDYRNSLLSALLLPGLLFSVSSSENAFADVSENITRMFSEGKTTVGFRYRFENVEQDNLLRDATASTLRTRLTFQTAAMEGFTALLEADNVVTVGRNGDRYDSFLLDAYRGTHSVIADPVGTELNQAWLRFAFDGKNSATLGRQRVNHAGQRFIGGVAWRQNEQTFDSVSYSYSDAHLTLDYSYLWNVNRILEGSRSSVQTTDFDSSSHAALVSNKFAWGTLSGFIYALDFSNALTASSVSYGLSYSGKLSAMTLNASYATQSDHGDNPLSYRADYLSVEASVPVDKFNFLLGYEMLGSHSGAIGFSTPLATLHKFQGFADMFLTTPVNGVEDIYITASTIAGNLHFALTWHDFESDRGSISYGQEWNFLVGYKFSDNIYTELKLASYDSDGFAVDTDKIWLSVNMAF